MDVWCSESGRDFIDGESLDPGTNASFLRRRHVLQRTPMELLSMENDQVQPSDRFRLVPEPGSFAPVAPQPPARGKGLVSYKMEG